MATKTQIREALEAATDSQLRAVLPSYDYGKADRETLLDAVTDLVADGYMTADEVTSAAKTA